jgi:hypothetical protein
MMRRYGGRNFGEIDYDKQAVPEDGWLYRGSLLALSKDTTANGVSWSLIAHAAASNLKSTSPCLIQDLCNNHPSALFDICCRACRRISVGYCSLSSSFFSALLASQVSLLGLRELILLDCIMERNCHIGARQLSDANMKEAFLCLLCKVR